MPPSLRLLRPFWLSCGWTQELLTLVAGALPQENLPSCRLVSRSLKLAGEGACTRLAPCAAGQSWDLHSSPRPRRPFSPMHLGLPQSPPPHTLRVAVPYEPRQALPMSLLARMASLAELDLSGCTAVLTDGSLRELISCVSATLERLTLDGCFVSGMQPITPASLPLRPLPPPQLAPNKEILQARCFPLLRHRPACGHHPFS